MANILDLCEISLFSARNLALFREVSSPLKTFVSLSENPAEKFKFSRLFISRIPSGRLALSLVEFDWIRLSSISKSSIDYAGFELSTSLNSKPILSASLYNIFNLIISWFCSPDVICGGDLVVSESCLINARQENVIDIWCYFTPCSTLGARGFSCAVSGCSLYISPDISEKKTSGTQGNLVRTWLTRCSVKLHTSGVKSWKNLARFLLHSFSVKKHQEGAASWFDYTILVSNAKLV